MFRTLTVRRGSVAVRRPRTFSELCGDHQRRRSRVDGRASAAVVQDVRGSAQRFVSDAVVDDARTPATVIDVSHESLMRKWRRRSRLGRRRSAERGVRRQDLARDVARYRTREVSVWQDPELAGVAAAP